YRGDHSIHIIGAARTAFLVGPHPTDEGVRVLACTKNNLVKAPASLAFRIASNALGVPVIHWLGPVDVSADDLVLTPARGDSAAVRHARDFLQKLLEKGPCRSGEIFRRALAAGISRRTVERAKEDLEITAGVQIQDGKRGWYWKLDNGADEDEDDSLSWAEKEKRVLAEAQKQSDEHMARIRAKYGKEGGSKEEVAGKERGASSQRSEDRKEGRHAPPS